MNTVQDSFIVKTTLFYIVMLHVSVMVTINRLSLCNNK